MNKKVVVFLVRATILVVAIEIILHGGIAGVIVGSALITLLTPAVRA